MPIYSPFLNEYYFYGYLQANESFKNVSFTFSKSTWNFVRMNNEDIRSDNVILDYSFYCQSGGSIYSLQAVWVENILTQDE